jgi:hypothetical protein
VRRLGLLVCVLAGCLDYSAIVDPSGPSAGGAVSATMNDGQSRTTSALGHGKQDPLTVEGASPELTFALSCGDSAAGSTRLILAQPGGAVELSIDDNTHLEVHLDGSGCVAQSGVVHLSSDGNNHLGGDFSATGTVFGGAANCRTSGTLANIPVDR